MAKRKYLSDDDLRIILESDEFVRSDEDEECADFSSDDSIKDPGYNPSPNTSENEEDDEVVENIEEVIQDLQLEEESEELDRQSPEVPEIFKWTEYEGRHKTFTFTGNSGLQIDVAEDITPFDAFTLFVDDEIINIIVVETNRYAEQKFNNNQTKSKSRMTKWVPTDSEEIKKFLGLLIWMGLVRLGSIPSYWSTSDIYKNNVAAKIMSRNRFELLLSNIHFSNNEEIPQGDRLGKIQPLIDALQKKFQDIMIPAQDFVIDETLIPWRGRLVFRQYIPNKAHRYGIKLFKLCSTEGYTWSSKIYSGKSENYTKRVGLGRTVCEELSKGLLNQGRTLFVDNFYTSYELALSFLHQNTHVVGTLKSNKNICHEKFYTLN